MVLPDMRCPGAQSVKGGRMEHLGKWTTLLGRYSYIGNAGKVGLRAPIIHSPSLSYREDEDNELCYHVRYWV